MKTFLLFFTVLLGGCASTGEIAELQKFDGKLDHHKKVLLVGKDQRFARILAKEIAKTEIFDNVSVNEGKGATLKIVSQITRVKEPSDVSAVLFNTLANSEVELDVQLFELSPRPRQLAALHVQGNSKGRGRTTVAGVGITDASDFTETAMEEAAERIAKYLLDHSNKAPK